MVASLASNTPLPTFSSLITTPTWGAGAGGQAGRWAVGQMIGRVDEEWVKNELAEGTATHQPRHRDTESQTETHWHAVAQRQSDPLLRPKCNSMSSF